MVCSICGQAGHNRRTCPQRNTTGLINQPTPPHNPPPNRIALTRKFWRTTIQIVLDLKRFGKITLLLAKNKENPKYAYFQWLKIRELNKSHTFSIHLNGNTQISYRFWDSLFDNYSDGPNYIKYQLQLTYHACLEFHKARNPVKDNKRSIKLINMRNENYLIYWVVGNLMIEDIDSKENSINYIGMLRKNNTFGLSTAIGHRFYLVPHRLDLEPPYHPQTDKQFFIEPYLQLNIHEGSNKEIHIDDGEKLSELNRWKFNALKLDYLIREMIKLGAKNNETLDVVLDLHEDIQLDPVSEWYKDIAGVPSTFTNIT
tara:strand:- start:629 stop:1570 length:942 start_codon:yes stop_codon:yes gene_type:complete